MVNDEECKKAVIEWMRFGLRDFLFGSSFTGALCTHDGMTLNDLDDMVANGEFLAFPLLAKGGGPAFPGELKWVYCKSLKMLWYEWNEAGLFPKTNEHPKEGGIEPVSPCILP
jgi:hypothetical protein